MTTPTRADVLALLDECEQRCMNCVSNHLRYDIASYFRTLRTALTSEADSNEALENCEHALQMYEDGRKQTEELLTLVETYAALYMRAVQDIFDIGNEGQPLFLRDTTKDPLCLKAFARLNERTQQLQSALLQSNKLSPPVARSKAPSEASIIADAATKEMDKAVQCLYIAVTESVARDVDARWQAVKAAIRKLGEGHG